MEETSSRHHDIPTPCHRQGCQALDQKINEAAQGPIQPHSGYLQGWGIHDFSGQPDPEHYCPLCGKTSTGCILFNNYMCWSCLYSLYNQCCSVRFPADYMKFNVSAMSVIPLCDFFLFDCFVFLR